ncbi:MAG: ferrous iron transport protein A [Puniceicoccales bacterium]|nr:ferrous iron transport protein A [Puniceicoccales bacterium]
MTTLATLKTGQTGRLTRLDAQRPVEQRLLAFGFLPGTRVRLARSAPLGDPLEIEFQNQSVTIRRSEAATIEIEPDAA